MKTFAEFLNEALDTTSKFENELLKRGVIIKSGEEKLFIDARSAKNIAKVVERVLEYI